MLHQLQFPDMPTPQRMTSDSHRAAYHLQRGDATPLVEKAERGKLRVRDIVPSHEGLSRPEREIGHRSSGRYLLSPHPESRDNYPHSEGQMVMGVHDLSESHELDHHGNVPANLPQNWFERNTAGKNDRNERQWQQHGVMKQISTSAVLHTAQPAEDTFDHSYITGPMDKGAHADILIQGGVPYVADGHHRLAEARGRGLTHFNARVRNLDEETSAMPRIATPKVKRTGDEMRAHLEEHHDVHPGMFALPMYRTANVAQRHDVLHRQEFQEHVHP